MLETIKGTYSLPHHLKPIKILFQKLYELMAVNSPIPMDEIDKKTWSLTAKSCYSKTFSRKVLATLNVLETSSQYSVLHDKTNLQLMQANFQQNPHLSSNPLVSQNYNSLLHWKLYILYLHYNPINCGKTKNNCEF